MNSVTVTLPLPPRALSPNGRAHWAAVRAAKSVQKDSAWGQTYNALSTIPGPWSSAVVSVTYYVRDSRGMKRDGDNALASLKAAFDGIAEAASMNDRAFTYEPVKFCIDKDNPRVEITVRKDDQ